MTTHNQRDPITATARRGRRGAFCASSLHSHDRRARSQYSPQLFCTKAPQIHFVLQQKPERAGLFRGMTLAPLLPGSSQVSLAQDLHQRQGRAHGIMPWIFRVGRTTRAAVDALRVEAEESDPLVVCCDALDSPHSPSTIGGKLPKVIELRIIADNQSRWQRVHFGRRCASGEARSFIHDHRHRLIGIMQLSQAESTALCGCGPWAQLAADDKLFDPRVNCTAEWRLQCQTPSWLEQDRCHDQADATKGGLHQSSMILRALGARDLAHRHCVANGISLFSRSISQPKKKMNADRAALQTPHVLANNAKRMALMLVIHAVSAAPLVPGGACSSDEACSNHGVCLADVCACERAWTGIDCSTSSCPRGCSGHGSCSLGHCMCESSWVGAACNVPHIPCPHDCSGHGRGCLAGGPCICAEGYTGADCSQTSCDGNCNHHGVCSRAGVCACDEGYGGDGCKEPLCPGGCGGHGHCAAPGRCVCAGGWGGARCDEEACDGRVWRNGAWLTCSGHGLCLADGDCECEPGWEGTGCELAP